MATPTLLDVRVIPPREKHATIFRTFDALAPGIGDRDGGPDLMRATAETGEHPYCIRFVHWFAEQLGAERHRRVSRHHRGIARARQFESRAGLRRCQPAHQIIGALARARRFVDRHAQNLAGDTELGEQLTPARRP